ncbi:hypothetical protein CUU64_03205 [Bacillus sp. V5-8f]|nr:hypothetical protein CUU64_03205 [Bacillus sp. V5-8f]
MKRRKDLEGKTIGYPVIPLNGAILKTMVSEEKATDLNEIIIEE